MHTFWYADRIGDVFEVDIDKDSPNECYWFVSNIPGNLIYKDDCEVVMEEVQNGESIYCLAKLDNMWFYIDEGDIATVLRNWGQSRSSTLLMSMSDYVLDTNQNIFVKCRGFMSDVANGLLSRPLATFTLEK